MKKRFLLNRIFDTLSKPAKYEKEIKSVYIDKKNFVMVTFTDDDKAKFYTKYADKLLKGNHIQFSARLKETQRMDIRNNKEIQDALGFDGFIIHTTAEAWIDKLNKIIK